MRNETEPLKSASAERLAQRIRCKMPGIVTNLSEPVSQRRSPPGEPPGVFVITRGKVRRLDDDFPPRHKSLKISAQVRNEVGNVSDTIPEGHRVEKLPGREVVRVSLDEFRLWGHGPCQANRIGGVVNGCHLKPPAQGCRGEVPSPTTHIKPAVTGKTRLEPVQVGTKVVHQGGAARAVIEVVMFLRIDSTGAGRGR